MRKTEMKKIVEGWKGMSSEEFHTEFLKLRAEDLVKIVKYLDKNGDNNE